MFNPDLVEWLQRGDRGVSSETIVEVLEGLPIGTLVGRNTGRCPQDPSDFRRCVLLLRAVPSYRARLGELASVSPGWAALVEHWQELEDLLSEEIGPALVSGQAERTYQRMRALQKV